MLEGVIEHVTNREDWQQRCEVRDDDNELIDLSTAVIVLTMQGSGNRNQTRMTCSTADSTITIVGLGVFQFWFTETQMRTVPVDAQYKVGCTIRLNGLTRQFFIGTVPVVDGVVP